MLIGREQEKKLLEIVFEKPKIITIFGRRRVGKTFLIKEVFKKNLVLFFEGLEGKDKKTQLINFKEQLEMQLDLKLNPFKTWREAFLVLDSHLKKIPNKYIIVFDELQWMANYRNDLVADLKMVWDNYLSNTTQGLILCGSIASFMVNKVINSSALFGRINNFIHLKPLLLNETKEFFPEKNYQEILEVQLVFGGIPLYLEMTKKYSSIQIAIQSLMFEPNSYFLAEFNRIFTSHFGKQTLYQDIVVLLAKNIYGLSRKEIQEKLKSSSGGTLSTCLDNLEKAGFLLCSKPINKNKNSKLIRYCLCDQYTSFYFNFIKDKKLNIEQSNRDLFFKIKETPKYYSWLGRSFEILIFNHANIVAKYLGFEGITYTYGPYFNRKTNIQIDLVFDRSDKVMTLCEIKFGNIDIKDIDIVEKKKEFLQKNNKNKTIQTVLITNNNVSDLIRSKFYKVIEIENFFN